VGDKVRLKAGGLHVMHVFGVQDYGNMLECEWYDPAGSDNRMHDTFPVRSLVRVEPSKTEGA
jgi:uncharacterized protein YodC (DUF2158 family)